MRKQRIHWLPQQGWTWPWAALLVVAVIAVPCLGNASGTEDSARAAVPSGTVTTVPLEYHETNYRFVTGVLLFREVGVEVRSSPFPKEPGLADDKVVRGVLRFGGNPTNAM